MELKKSVKADLEWRKPTFFQIGLFISVLLVFLVFEFVGASEKLPVFTVGTGMVFDDEMIIQTEEQQKYMAPPPPSLPLEQITGSIEVVQNDVRVADFEISAETFEEQLVIDEVYEIGAPGVEVIDEAEPLFQNVEEAPEFPGGEVARIRFLRDNVVYPRQAKDAGLEGLVMVSFIVEPDGSITNVQIFRGRAPILDEEAIRVTKLMPRWKSGKQNGKAVRVQCRMPITFTLQD